MLHWLTQKLILVFMLTSSSAKRRVCIREYGCLVEGLNAEGNERAEGNAVAISKSAFGYLKSLIQDDSREADYAPFLKLTTYKRQIALKVQNYVGVMQTPCGTLIEVLPKLHSGEEETEEKTRSQLIRMLRSLRNSPFKQAEKADIRDANMPLLEVYITQFLALTNQLIKRGIRSDYIREQKNAQYLKGRLLVSQQIRKNAMHPERFAIECDEYQINRPANRLIKLTLERVRQASQSSANQRLARELSFVFEEVPASSDIRTDFQKVKLSRGMSYYQEVLSWCQLLLNGHGPTASSGNFNTLSLLYPMERIFEDYVAHCLRKNIEDVFDEGAVLKTQSSKHSLVEDHDGSKIFNLRPDLMVMRGNEPVRVMDTKWKLIDGSDRRHKYGISQADMYQLYAYGHKYLKGNEHKKLMLIYPKTDKFQEPLPVFKYEDGFELSVVPFDLDSGILVV
jgi:5-methylcytosine-specific restriction enzyme subunit McrC